MSRSVIRRHNHSSVVSSATGIVRVKVVDVNSGSLTIARRFNALKRAGSQLDVEVSNVRPTAGERVFIISNESCTDIHELLLIPLFRTYRLETINDEPELLGDSDLRPGHSLSRLVNLVPGDYAVVVHAPGILPNVCWANITVRP
jgi:hypothetical protein